MSVSRRHFLQTAAAVTAGFSGLGILAQRASFAGLRLRAWDRFGPLQPERLGVLELPKGFSCTVLSRVGERMDDGLIVTGMHDGMAAFEGPDGQTILVRNHEMERAFPFPRTFGSQQELLTSTHRRLMYDAGTDTIPSLGGTSTLLVDTHNGKGVTLKKHWMSLAGTERNCAGGPTPWNTWITCEETNFAVGDGFAKNHGYNFEVPATAEMKLHKAEPLVAMGRFRHEAIAVDPRTSIVYQSEDLDDGVLYRFIPNTPEVMRDGGRLQALRVLDRPSLDTRNWESPRVKPGHPMAVDWIDVEDVESPDDSLRFQSFGKGAALFARNEGMWQALGAIYFACTTGGATRTGQIWRLTPSVDPTTPDTLELFVEPNDPGIMENPDNITFSPTGDMIVCEDGLGSQFLLGITPQGQVYKIAKNILNGSEFAGACFSPDGTTLFVNLQYPGWTLAIQGPWRA